MSAPYKDLIVWQKSMDLVVLVYKITEEFPKSELFALTAQLRRAVVSIPSNIAEGKYRSTTKDCKHFFSMSFGSGAEVETQLEIGFRLGYVSEPDFTKAIDLLSEIMKILNVLISNLANS